LGPDERMGGLCENLGLRSLADGGNPWAGR
jgi:hypothetical protein